jgi:hypothetical protein
MGTPYTHDDHANIELIIHEVTQSLDSENFGENKVNMQGCVLSCLSLDME